MAEQM